MSKKGKVQENEWIHRLEIHAIAWKTSLKSIGQVLCEAKEAGQPVDLWRRTILQQQHGVPMATSLVAMRWASGDLGDDKTAQDAIGKIGCTVLSKMTKETLHDVIHGRHRIASGVEGCVVEKSFDEMAKSEIKDNITPQGFAPIIDRAKAQPEFRAYRAANVFMDGLDIVFAGGFRHEIRMRVSRQLLLQAQGLISQVAEVA